MAKAIGIDFGTTASAVAVLEGKQPCLIPNTEGGFFTPSVVAVADGERLVGTPAQRQAVTNPQGTLFAIKRLLGRSLAENVLQGVPYQIVQGPHDTLQIAVHDQQYTPEAIVALVLRKLADDAGRALGEPVKDVVISVPASFTHPQRQAVWQAARVAQLHVLRLLNEPTAAALAYSFQRPQSATVMIVDLGGGTSEVSIVEIGGGVCEVRASVGDPLLGGNDFEQCLAEHVAERGKQEYGLDCYALPQSHAWLSAAVERAKCELSSTTQTTITLPDQRAKNTGLQQFSVPLSRAQFERLTAPLVQRCAGLLEQALAAARVSPADLDGVLLVGGATRMPMIQSLVQKTIGGKVLTRPVHPDEGIALGAAIQAGMLTGLIKGAEVFDVVPFDLSMELPTGSRTGLIAGNTSLPCRQTTVLSTLEANQTTLECQVLQGTFGTAVAPRSIGRVRVEGLRPAPRGVPRIALTFDFDLNGLLSVTARDDDTGTAYQVTFHTLSPHKQ